MSDTRARRPRSAVAPPAGRRDRDRPIAGRPRMLDLQRTAGNGAACALLRAPADAAECPARPPGEVERSRAPGGILDVDAVYLEGDNTVEIADFPVASATPSQDFLSTTGWQRAASRIVGDPGAKVAILGYTDCVGAGSLAEDRGLRQRRADGLVAALPPPVRARVTLAIGEFSGTYLNQNASPEGRARNRAVKLRIIPSDSRTNPGALVPAAASLDQYLFLVRGLEARLGLTRAQDAPTALSALRQVYYGSAAWSAHTEGIWDQVITDRPWKPGTDPTPQLGAPLMAALKASQVVEGRDIGHVLTGLDAMMKPGVARLPGVVDSTIQNEALATWSGDVGSAAAAWAMDQHLGTAKGDDRYFFRELAGDADLAGDIDAFAIRAGLSGAAPGPGLVGAPLSLSGRLSDVLLDYFRTTGTALGGARQGRARGFVAAFGGTVAGGRVSNRAVVEAALRPQIREFTVKKVQYLLVVKGMSAQIPPNAPDLGVLMETAATVMTRRFVDWLEARLAAEGP